MIYDDNGDKYKWVRWINITVTEKQAKKRRRMKYYYRIYLQTSLERKRSQKKKKTIYFSDSVQFIFRDTKPRDTRRLPFSVEV